MDKFVWTLYAILATLFVVFALMLVIRTTEDVVELRDVCPVETTCVVTPQQLDLLVQRGNKPVTLHEVTGADPATTCTELRETILCHVVKPPGEARPL